MQNITNRAELISAIHSLELEQQAQGQLLKEQFFITYENFKPINLLRNTLREAFSSPNLVNNLIGTSVGLASGYLSKKIIVGASANIFRKLLGSLLEFGVSNVVSQHPQAIKSIGQLIFQRLFNKKEQVPPEEERTDDFL